MVVIRDKIEQLNDRIAHEKAIKKSSSTNVHQFGKQIAICLAFYQNGMTVDDGPFRPYHWDLPRHS